MRLIKFKRPDFTYPEFGIVKDGTISPIKDLHSVSDLFQAISNNSSSFNADIPLEGINPLPPTDGQVHIYCAGLNYLDHALETRMPVPKSPVFFTKSNGAMCGAYDDIIYPKSVTLLDYEIELAVIIGRTINAHDVVTPDNLGEFIIGITILNDISARDVQLSVGQWFLGKSYRTFAPLGPVLQTIDDAVVKRLYDLDLSLQVFTKNGDAYPNKSQTGRSGNMIFKIHELINCLREKFDLRPGDVVATGTPRGVALSQPPRIRQRIAEIIGIPQSKRIEIFLDKERNGNKKYLEPGDTISATISSPDEIVKLGEQRNRVVPG
ncbi:MAG: fumarylacetoacetate hydrolase family protein [Spirochaetes bacterium]|nr:fumarylacetoacetate hydrolase family protein [Spirochaetota bacterium]